MNRQTSSVDFAFYLCGLLFFLVLTNCATALPRQKIDSDAEFAATMSAGRVAFDQGLIEQAASLYQQALKRARIMDNRGGDR